MKKPILNSSIINKSKEENTRSSANKVSTATLNFSSSIAINAGASIDVPNQSKNLSLSSQFSCVEPFNECDKTSGCAGNIELKLLKLSSSIAPKGKDTIYALSSIDNLSS